MSDIVDNHDLRDRLQTILQYAPTASLRAALELVDKHDRELQDLAEAGRPSVAEDPSR